MGRTIAAQLSRDGYRTAIAYEPSAYWRRSRATEVARSI